MQRGHLPLACLACLTADDHRLHYWPTVSAPRGPCRCGAALRHLRRYRCGVCRPVPDDHGYSHMHRCAAVSEPFWDATKSLECYALRLSVSH